jgi:hypothetical protein
MVQIAGAVLLILLTLAARDAKAADLVVWWDKGAYPQEDEAVGEIVAAFEQKTGKQVELVQPTQDEIIEQVQSALQAGAPPDFLFSVYIHAAADWAYQDRLVDLKTVLGSALDLFDADAIEVSTLVDSKTGLARPLRPANGPQLQSRSCVAEPARAGGLHARGCSEAMGGFLAVLVRSRAAGSAQGAGSGERLGRRAVDVGRGY